MSFINDENIRNYFIKSNKKLNGGIILNTESFGMYKIYRPKIFVEQETRTFIEGELFKEYESKVYTQYDEMGL